MQNYEIDIIQLAFKRCFGLQDCLSSKDVDTVKAAVDSLAYQTGMRKSFILTNLNEIKKIN